MKYLVMVIRANALSPDIRLFIEALDANNYRKVTIKQQDVVAVYLYKYVNDWRNEKCKNLSGSASS